MSYITVSVDVDVDELLEDVCDEELIEEVERRGLVEDVYEAATKEIFEKLYNDIHMYGYDDERVKDHISDLIYDYVGKNIE